MRISEIKGNLKTLEEQSEAITKRLDRFDRRIEEIRNKVATLDEQGETK